MRNMPLCRNGVINIWKMWKHNFHKLGGVTLYENPEGPISWTSPVFAQDWECHLELPRPWEQRARYCKTWMQKCRTEFRRRQGMVSFKFVVHKSCAQRQQPATHNNNNNNNNQSSPYTPPPVDGKNSIYGPRAGLADATNPASNFRKK